LEVNNYQYKHDVDKRKDECISLHVIIWTSYVTKRVTKTIRIHWNALF